MSQMITKHLKGRHDMASTQGIHGGIEGQREDLKWTPKLGEDQVDALCISINLATTLQDRSMLFELHLKVFNGGKRIRYQGSQLGLKLQCFELIDSAKNSIKLGPNGSRSETPINMKQETI